MSISATSGTFGGGTLRITRNAISSPASADGASRCDSPDGATIGLFGPVPVPVSRSHRSASKLANATRATFGRRSDDSSPSERLQSCLANKLRRRLADDGSPEYALTWKEWRMPSPPPICALRASARRTPDSDFIGWVTPSARDWKDSPGMATTGTNPDGSTRLRLDQLPRQVIGARSMSSNVATGKARRIEPGSFPLAHGVPARVGRLRAYGNAIVPQLAAEFIGACLDVIADEGDE
jgi:hypothetical protein